MTISTADFENQGAHRLAKHYDPDGKRTIGLSPLPYLPRIYLLLT